MQNFIENLRNFIPYLLAGTCLFLIGYSVCLMAFGKEEDPIIVKNEPSVRDLLDSLESIPSAIYVEE